MRRARASRHPAAVLLATASLAALAACADPPSAPGRVTPRARPSADVTSAAVPQPLWVQTTGVYQGLGLLPGNTLRIADDFVVPAATTWSVYRVVVTACPNPTAPVTLLTITFHQDQAGLPGPGIASFTVAPTSATPHDVPGGDCFYDYALDLPSVVTLPPGAYWLAVDCSPTAVRLCGLVLPVTGHVARWSANGLPWIPVHDVLHGVLPPSDLAFALHGTETTPSDVAQDLRESVGELGLPAGTQTSLDAKLRQVVEAIAAGDTAAACRALNAFMNEVRAQAGKQLTEAQAAVLLGQAAHLRTLFDC